MKAAIGREKAARHASKHSEVWRAYDLVGCENEIQEIDLLGFLTCVTDSCLHAVPHANSAAT